MQHLDVITGCRHWDWKGTWKKDRLGLSVMQEACLSVCRERSAMTKRWIQRVHVDVSSSQTV
jgi:hypothetical protein